MDDQADKPRPRTCPHCGKEIPLLTKLPRDLGLLVHFLMYRVPVEAEITEAWIEIARKHCRMKPERLANLRAGDHARHWPRMLERRAARLAYFKAHGDLPPRWLGLLPGEPNHYSQLVGLRRYRKGGLAKLKSRLRKHPDTAGAKLTNRYLATRRLRSTTRKSTALDDVLARLTALIGAQAGKLKLAQYEALQAVMLREDALPRRFRKKNNAAMGCDAEQSPKTAGRERGRDVPQRGPDAIQRP